MIYQARIGHRTLHLELRLDGRRAEVTIDGSNPQVDLARLSPYAYSLIIDGQSHHLTLQPGADDIVVRLRQRNYLVNLRSGLDLTIEKLGLNSAAENQSGVVLAPIPGVISSLAVAVGDTVAAGAQLLVLEAMKMENELPAPFAGTVSALHVAAGDTVNKGDRLIELTRRQSKAP